MGPVGRLMSIPANLAALFPDFIRKRGEKYFRDGAVAIASADRGRIEAVVSGSELYDVFIDLSNGLVDHSCTCPAWDDYGNCKHVWATVLQAESLGLIRFAGPGGRAAPATPGRARTPKEPAWQRQLRRIRDSIPQLPPGEKDQSWPGDRRIVYIVDVPSSQLYRNELAVTLATEKQLPGGEWKPPKQFSMSEQQWANAPDPLDREIAQMLTGARSDIRYPAYGVARQYYLPRSAYDTTLRLMCETGRCRLRLGNEEDPAPLAWDPGTPWEFRVALTPTPAPDNPDAIVSYRLEGWLVRGGERIPVSEPALLVPGLAIRGGLVAAVRDHAANELMLGLAQDGSVDVPADDIVALLRELHQLPALPPLELPDSVGVRQEQPSPVPVLRLVPDAPTSWQQPKVTGELSFRYGETLVSGDVREAAVVDEKSRLVIRRDPDAERAARKQLHDLGFRLDYDYARHGPALRIAAARVARVITSLVAEGWIVETERGLVRPGADLQVEVASGIDWFELRGGADFGGVRATLPELLAALRAGRNMVALADGSIGMLPDEWRQRLGALAGVGDSAGGAVRFTRAQVGLLDALLAAMPAAAVDVQFEHARRELLSFASLSPADPPPGFVGELRDYQREGLAWLHFLQRFGFGGCLADDMGLGKTVQALALLEERRATGAGPSLVVVPRSLLFNWRLEAARFTPAMRVLIHEGRERTRDAKSFGAHDLVLITYGTLRRDAPLLARCEFDYIVLDEAQAIKNAGTESAKAARLLRGRHRLAMSGTPVENRLAELWSLFEFLNPGMLGAARVFKSLGALEGGEEGRRLIARAVRPFVLRRTKEQVAPELPEKLEQTIYVELEPAERKRYDELRDHYRGSLLGRIDREGIRRAKIQILEALLRLRQAACHSGLLDAARAAESSSKFDLLVPKLAEVIAEGHKALVFSQFTSLLALLEPHLARERITYEYLDGQTRDRQQRVERFQTDPACGVFLISLKAGGLGLNLTAADYVFLLDPWWNPAVEAQAIDRTHRIGQTRRVFASRLIARGTVEEKVLELQESKRDLAEAIIGGDASVISRIRREDLELLLG